jgi:hypothetical protein
MANLVVACVESRVKVTLRHLCHVKLVQKLTLVTLLAQTSANHTQEREIFNRLHLETWKHYWLPWKLGEIIGCLGNLEKLLVALPLKLKNYWLP